MSDSMNNSSATGNRIVSATFQNRADAQQAVEWLRSNGVDSDAISVVSQQGATGDAGDHVHEAASDASDAGKGALSGAAVGAGVGALFGLAALAIPGVGPFITAGWLAQALGTTGGALAAGAIVGGTSGSLAGALSHWGLNEAESHHYAGEVERGGTYVGVDVSRAGVDRSTIEHAFRRFNGSTYTQQRAAA
jgi:hypothetical protein